MKKHSPFLFLLVLLLSFCGCTYTNPIVDSLPAFKSQETYSRGGFQDITEYTKYTYKSLTEQDFFQSKLSEVTTPDNATEIRSYLENFEQCVEVAGDELRNNYDLKPADVTEGDFFYIKTKEGQPIGERTYEKFENYTVYFFDMDTQVLHYLHHD